MEQGSDFAGQIGLVDVTNNPINLTNFIISSQMKQSVLSQNVDATFVVSTANAQGGLIQLGLSSANTANLVAPYRYLYDVVLYNTISNTITRVLEGTIFVSPGISTYPALYPPPPVPNVNAASSAANAASNFNNLLG